MSIWGSIPGLDEEHAEDCTIWVHDPPGSMFLALGPAASCTCHLVHAPYQYLGSGHVPSTDDPHGGSINLALIASHITRDGRDNGNEYGPPLPWLRLDVTADDETVVITPGQARLLAKRLNYWADEADPGDGQPDFVTDLAENGVDTPGCDCGHNRMGVGWHDSHCPWRRTSSARTVVDHHEDSHDESHDVARPVPKSPQSLRDRVAADLHAQLPGCTHDEHGADCQALAETALTAIQAGYVPPPPGSDRDALPPHLRPLIAPHMPPYTSTYCQTADACTTAAGEHPEHADELLTWAERARQSCRITRKQDMAACQHPRHTEGD